MAEVRGETTAASAGSRDRHDPARRGGAASMTMTTTTAPATKTAAAGGCGSGGGSGG